MEYTAPGATRPLYADFLDVAGRADAAALFRESARCSERVASLALETVSGLGAYTEICEQRMQLVMSRGEKAREEIRTLGKRANALAEEYGAPDADHQDRGDRLRACRHPGQRRVPGPRADADAGAGTQGPRAVG
ncbi:hypothetical protein ACIQCD_05000 [Streptomyces sp. NPDC093250]|uniref:hypothetical protein n=1 Tax=unclassified Streptomyces TaxID=2593676 RepID=UPI00341D5F5B